MEGAKRKNDCVLCFQEEQHLHVISQSSKGNRMKLCLMKKISRSKVGEIEGPVSKPEPAGLSRSKSLLFS